MPGRASQVVTTILILLVVAGMAVWAADGDNFGIGAGQPDPAQRWQQLLERFDQDHDGKISQEEYQGPGEAFTRLDANGDGFITQNEQGGGNAGGGEFMQRMREMLENADKDGDGKISRDEWPGQDEGFKRFDKNGDGFIDADEMPKFNQPGGGQGGGFRDMDPAQRWQKMCERMDANKDGQIAEDEFMGPEKFFDLLDRNRDGVITEDEGKAVGPPDGGPGGPAGRGDQPGGGNADRFKMMIKQWDQDGDGKVSKAEWQGREEMFGRLDADADGFVTEQELGNGMGDALKPRNPVQQLIGLLDEDADGQVSEEEWGAFFDATDGNGNGFLTQDELMKAMRPPDGNMPPPPAGGDAPPPPPDAQ